MPDANELARQLTGLPSIVGELGISIAQAQKALNADYIATLQQTMKLINETVSIQNAPGVKDKKDAVAALEKEKASVPKGTPFANESALTTAREALDTAVKAVKENDQTAWNDRIAVVKQLITALAPSRYQFSETTLDFSADLAQSQNTSLGVSAGVGYAAVTVSAAFSLAYGYDYRAAARIKTTLHAMPPDKDLLKEFLGRANSTNASPLTLPAKCEPDEKVLKGLKEIMEAAPKAPTKPE